MKLFTRGSAIIEIELFDINESNIGDILVNFDKTLKVRIKEIKGKTAVCETLFWYEVFWLSFKKEFHDAFEFLFI